MLGLGFTSVGGEGVEPWEQRVHVIGVCVEHVEVRPVERH
jgi:hypothetical protein